MSSASRDVVLNTDIPELEPFIKGKVRDVYDLDYQLLIVTTDRISAFDSVLPTGIPDKGRVLNQLSAFWFDKFQNLCPSHFISTDLDQIASSLRVFTRRIPEELLAGRSMLVNKVQALPVECVVRGYLEGSAWKEYQRSGTVCGIQLPAGLQQGSQLPEPIFTPSTKAQTGHDENITHEQMAELVEPGFMRQVIRYSLDVYTQAAEYARERGVIIADTKFEFGIFQSMVVMIDECLTPDSSRFWDAERWRPGGPQPSYDKQFVRDYLDESGWNHEPPAPPLPDDVVRKTSEKYREIYTRLTDQELD
jgi:phosphoribosylaminoimidazole-succinocarboxamide synthase